MDIFEFDALIMKQDKINAAFIEIPFSVEEAFGTKGQVKVSATFDGIEYRGSLARMGHPCHILGLTQKIREAIGKAPGEIVHVVLKRDAQDRIVAIPQDLLPLLLENPKAMDCFESLSYTNKKKYADWITDAKKAETRAKRLQATINILLTK